MVLVKAAPVLTSDLDESMCVAAMTLDDDPRWIRLHPVPFRDLDDESKFKKYQEINVRAIRPSSDRRPESWSPIEGSIEPGQVIGSEHGWSARRDLIARLGERTMCELIAENKGGSGPGITSLAVVRAAEPPELEITQRDNEQLDKWRRRAQGMAAQSSLFDDPVLAKPVFEVIPWRFRYKYRCIADGCPGHSQTIIDWEAVALYHKVRGQADWRDRMEQKFVDELWASKRDTRLFVGNQKKYRQGFLVLGVFWPPRQALQASLL